MTVFPYRHKTTTANAACARRLKVGPRRFAVITLRIAALLSATGGAAYAVVGGRTVSIMAAPWTVVLWEPTYPDEPRYAACTGVIIDSRHVLTAGHCATVGNSADTMQPSAFRAEAGVSNFKRPLRSDDPQFRAVSAVRLMPGYVGNAR